MTMQHYFKAEPQDYESFVPLFIGQKSPRIGIARTMWNSTIVDEIVNECIKKLNHYDHSNIHVVTVAGSYELPYVCQKIFIEGNCDVVIAIGCLIQGETAHMDIVANSVATSLQQISLQCGKAIIFGVTTCATVQQAIERIPLGQSYAMTALVASTTQEQQYLQTKIQNSLQIMKGCLDKRPVICFNGGKDCSVLLQLLSMITDIRDFPVLFLDAGPDEEFEEVRDAIHRITDHYELKNLHRVSLPSTSQEDLKSIVKTICSEHKYQTIFMGRRSIDSEGKTTAVSNWTGSVQQIDPIFNWSHSQVWHFILRKKIPYCSLYKNGYTSLGYRTNTKPNPHLMDSKPAWYLTDDRLERAGRF